MENKEEQKIPKVFISYSHDSPSHKKWVAELAIKLITNGVDVILDQWDLRLGADLTKFMEKGISESDRVLLICTENYVKKVDNGEGGAGYEGMIITAELYLDLGTDKFIPIIRQMPGSALLPKCMGVRHYANLSEGQNFDEEFNKLLKDLFHIPATPKPPLGKSPFDIEVMDEKSVPSSKATEISNLEDIDLLYKTAFTIAQNNDILSWRRIIRQAFLYIPDKLNQWREKYEKDISKATDDLPSMVLEGLSIYAPLFAISLTGIESRKEKFNNHTPILDEILFPKDWNRSGYTIITGFPETVAFFFQALHGAMCLLTDQFHLAINLARTTTTEFGTSESKSLWQRHDIMGWPPSLHKTTIAWDTLINLFAKFPWLHNFFASEEEYKESICAYYMALNILEYVETIASGDKNIFSQDLLLDIPVHFVRMNEEITRRAYHLLKIDTKQVIDIWKKRDIADSKIKEHWEDWIHICQVWLSKVYLGYSFKIPHKNLINDIFIT